MTKDEMVKALRYKAANIKAHIHPQFFIEIADYLEAQKVDAISRKAVDTLVDELARAISDERNHISRGRSTGEIMQDILDLPSVDPKQKWIPVSERPPEEGKTVMASTNYGVYPEARYSKKYGWEWPWEAGADYWTEIVDSVEAWMELPKPYKAGSKENEKTC